MLNILFPKYCPGCGSVLPHSQVLLCIRCRNALPLTRYHWQNNASIVDKFYGILPLNRGTALLHYHKKGLAQKIIHALKYQGDQALGQWLGIWLGRELKSIKDYRTISAVVPVPMHPKKLRLRGYNQAAIFGQALATAMEIPFIEHLLLQKQMRQTQAQQGRWARWAKTNTFALNPKSDHLIQRAFLSSKLAKNDNSMASIELLLVDDVITTGATIEACGQVLVRELGASLSCASIAIA